MDNHKLMLCADNVDGLVFANNTWEHDKTYSAQTSGISVRIDHCVNVQISNWVGDCSLLGQPTSHTTIRTVRHTAIQQFEWSVLYLFWISSYPKISSCLFVMERVITQDPAIHQIPRREFAHSHAFNRGMPSICSRNCFFFSLWTIPFAVPARILRSAHPATILHWLVFLFFAEYVSVFPGCVDLLNVSCSGWNWRSPTEISWSLFLPDRFGSASALPGPDTTRRGFPVGMESVCCARADLIFFSASCTSFLAFNVMPEKSIARSQP